MLNLRLSAVVLILAPWATAQTPPSTFQLTVSQGATSYLANFELHSARGPNLAVSVQQADGTFLPHTPGPVRTYLGALPARPGAMASALVRANGTICYHVLFEDGAEWINAGGTTTLRTNANWTPNYPTSVTGPGGAGSSIWAAEVGADLPFGQYAIDNNVDAALEMIEHSVNTVNLIYLRDAGILHRLGRVVVRAAAAQDPYAGMSTINAYLTELQNQWNNVLPASTHDVALVVTPFAGSGLAQVGVVGNPGYGAVGAASNGDFAIVWRHEVGHNWSLSHFDGGTPEGATINSGNSLARMSGSEEAKVVAHRSARASFLDNLGPYTKAIPPRASLDRAAYLPQATATIDVLANDHDGNGELLSIASFDAITRLGGSVVLAPGAGQGGRDALLYTPPSTISAQPDSFRYRIADTAGREGLGNVITQLTSDTELLVHLAMDEGTGAVAKDTSSYQRDADLSGGPVWSAGRLGGGITFDGVDDQLLAPPIERTTANLTITGWVRRNGTQSAWAGIAFCRGGTTTIGFGFGTNNELRYHWDGGQYTWNSGLVVPDNVWTFVALAVSPSAATISMDPGTGLQSAVHVAAHNAEAFDAALTIGRDPNSSARSFRGALDDLRIHARTLSPAEIAAAAAGLGSASNPQPGPFATFGQLARVTLAWTPTPAATGHRIYFSSTYAAVRDGLAVADQGSSTTASWTTPLLVSGTWFWRVDSTDGANWAMGPVWSFRTAPGGAQAPVYAPSGAGCTGPLGVPTNTAASALPRLGRELVVDIGNVPAPVAGLLYVGFSNSTSAFGPLPLDLGFLGASGCVGRVSTDLELFGTGTGSTLSFHLFVPNDVAYLGRAFFTQAFVLAPGWNGLGAVASDAAAGVVGN